MDLPATALADLMAGFADSVSSANLVIVLGIFGTFYGIKWLLGRLGKSVRGRV